MGKYLRIEDFGEHSAKPYEEEAIIKFLQDNKITVDDFTHIGRCDSECKCESNDYSVWREDIYFDQSSYKFKFEAENETDCVDFAIYICNKCGKWYTYIE